MVRCSECAVAQPRPPMLIVIALRARIVMERPCLRKDIEPLPLRFRALGATPAPDGTPHGNPDVVFSISNNRTRRDCHEKDFGRESAEAEDHRRCVVSNLRMQAMATAMLVA